MMSLYETRWREAIDVPRFVWRAIFDCSPTAWPLPRSLRSDLTCLPASASLPAPFGQISRADPERPFVIAVRIDEGGRYTVPECIPALPKEGFERMLRCVNETNDFGSFVSEVRRAFVRLAEAGL